MFYGVRYKKGGIVPATNRAQAERVASNLEGKVVLVHNVSTGEDDPLLECAVCGAQPAREFDVPDLDPEYYNTEPRCFEHRPQVPW